MLKKLKKIFGPSEVLYTSGELSRELLGLHENYRTILTDLGIVTRSFTKEIDFGELLYLSGKNMGSLIEKNKKILNKMRIRKIITSNPVIYEILGEYYKEYEREHAIETIFNMREKVKKFYYNESAFFHAHCSCGFGNKAAKVLSYAGIKAQEKEGLCAACSILPYLDEELCEQTALNDLVLLKKSGVGKVITSCPYCFSYLKKTYRKNKDKFKDFKIEVMEFSEVFIEI